MFSISMQVRDYECDLHGVVNNAVYQNYLEHARHCFLREKGIDFAELTAQGIHLMLSEIQLKFKAPLKPDDDFSVTVSLKKQGRIKYVFEQRVIRDGQICVEAEAVGIALSEKGKPMCYELLEQLVKLADPSL
jgi:acyl-CoA thioester hydrolase